MRAWLLFSALCLLTWRGSSVHRSRRVSHTHARAVEPATPNKPRGKRVLAPTSSAAPALFTDASSLYTDEWQARESILRLNHSHDGIVPRTRELMGMLLDHQNPSDGCEGQLFLRMPPFYGTGSQFHRAARVFLAALATGRIFDWHPRAFAFANHANRTFSNVKNFLLPPSSCDSTLAPASAVVDLDYPSLGALINGIHAKKSAFRPAFSFGKRSRKIAEIGSIHGRSPMFRVCIAYLMRLQVRRAAGPSQVG